MGALRGFPCCWGCLAFQLLNSRGNIANFNPVTCEIDHCVLLTAGVPSVTSTLRTTEQIGEIIKCWFHSYSSAVFRLLRRKTGVTCISPPKHPRSVLLQAASAKCDRRAGALRR